MKPSDLFTDPDGTLSTGKLWFNVGNAAMTAAFLWSSFHYELSAELLFAYGAVVVGNNVATRIIKSRYARRD